MVPGRTPRPQWCFWFNELLRHISTNSEIDFLFINFWNISWIFQQFLIDLDVPDVLDLDKFFVTSQLTRKIDFLLINFAIIGISRIFQRFLVDFEVPDVFDLMKFYVTSQLTREIDFLLINSAIIGLSRIFQWFLVDFEVPDVFDLMKFYVTSQLTREIDFLLINSAIIGLYLRSFNGSWSTSMSPMFLI